MMSNGMGLDLPKEWPELGRLRLGDQVAITKRNGEPGTRPRWLTEWRVTSVHKHLLAHVADVYGGEVTEWVDPRLPGPQWQVYTKSATLGVLVPTGALSQSWENWRGGSRQRCCNGTAMDTGEYCACVAEIEKRLSWADLQKNVINHELSDNDRRRLLRERLAYGRTGRGCLPKSRLSVVLTPPPTEGPEKRMPGVGLWRLDTNSVTAGIELPGTVDMLEGAMANRRLIPASLIIVQDDDKEVVERNGEQTTETRHFAYPSLQIHTVTALELGAAGAFAVLGSVAPTPELASGQRSLPPAPPMTVPDRHGPRPIDAEARPRPMPSVADTDALSLNDRLTALPSNAVKVACINTLRAEVGYPPAPEHLARASEIVASFESTDTPPEPPSGGPGPDGPSDPPPTPPQAPVVADDDTDAKIAQRAAEVKAREDAHGAEQRGIPVNDLDAALARGLRTPPEPGADRDATYQPDGGGPILPLGVTDAMLYGEEKMTQGEKAVFDRAWETHAHLLAARMDWLTKPRPSANPLPLDADDSPKGRGDALRAEKRSQAARVEDIRAKAAAKT